MQNQLFQVDLLTEEEVSSEDAPESVEPVKKEEVIEKKEVSEVKTEIPETIPLLTNEEVEEEAPEVEEEKEPQEEVKTGKPKSGKKFSPDAEYFKTLAQYHIDEGHWEEPEGWAEGKDNFDWNDKSFAELQKMQHEHKVAKALEEEKNAYGDQYKDLLEYAKNGGNVADLYSSFQQQNDIESLDPENESHAEQILEAYYESIGWDKSEIEEEIQIQKDRGLDKFKSLSSKRKADLVKAIQEDRSTEIEQAKRQKEQNDIYIQNRTAQERAVIHKMDLPEREKKEIEKFLYEKKYQGKYTEFDKVSSELRNKPEDFIQFINYLRNPNKFSDTKKAKEEEKKTIFSMLRGAQGNINKTTELPEFVGNQKAAKNWSPFIKK